MASDLPEELLPADGRSPSVESRWIAGILRTGLVVALAAMLAGVVVSARDVPLGAAYMDPFALSWDRPGAAIAMIGILVLAATPAVRVVALILLWARQGDRRFTLVALGAAVVLALASLSGRG